MYIPLHMHYVRGSVGDSILQVEDAVEKAKELNIPALAITDHGSMSSVVSFYKECNEKGIKPLLGMEAYEVDDRFHKEKGIRPYHLVLLAVNKKGYEDLLHIEADSQLNGFYEKPRTDFSVLMDYGNNLIALSACIGGRIPKMLSAILDETDKNKKEKMYEEVKQLVYEYKNIFYEFYLEIQPGNFTNQVMLNKLLVKLARDTDTKIIATNDVHYLNEEDAVVHDQHIKINRQLQDQKEMIYPDSVYYLMDEEEIIDLFPQLDKEVVEEAVKNTEEVYNAIDLSNLFDSNIKMPRCDLPEGYTEDEYLYELAHNMLYFKRHTIKDPSAYYSRLEYELNTLKEVGFSGYLLIIKDIYDYAYVNKIPIGPGRGSISGSLVAYLIGLTKVDPIKYGLMFERFISIHRKGSVPDIDSDCGSLERDKIFEYVVNKYGKEYCALVSTFQIRKAKTSIRDMAKVFGISNSIADKAAKAIPEVWFMENDLGEVEKKIDLSIKESLKISEELFEIYKKYPDWINASIRLEGTAKATSIHAAGALISPVKLEKFIPIIRNKDNSIINATALDLHDAEACGAIKYDFLGLGTLDIVQKTCNEIGFEPNYDDEEFLNDKETWELLGSKNIITLFQISSKLYQDRMPKIKPKTIPELAACLALVRGPCISNKSDQVYIDVIQGKRKVQKIHPIYDKITKYTNGILLYQEDLMKILHDFGFTLEDSFRVMKYASKKNKQALASAEKEFREYAEKKNASKKVQDNIWKKILDMGEYAFNASHAVSYALLCYLTAYLKAHYPTIWLAYALSYAYEKDKNVNEILGEIKRLGIKILPLDINESSWDFKPVGEREIRTGFVSVKCYGRKTYDELKRIRPINDIEDLVEKATRKVYNNAKINLTIFAGAFDSFGYDRVELYEYSCDIRKCKIENEISLGTGLKINKNDSLSSIENRIYKYPIINDPLKNSPYIDADNLYIGEVFNTDIIVSKSKEVTCKNGKKMAFGTFESNGFTLDVTIFPNIYSRYKEILVEGAFLSVEIKKGLNKDKTDDAYILQKVI